MWLHTYVCDMCVTAGTRSSPLKSFSSPRPRCTRTSTPTDTSVSHGWLQRLGCDRQTRYLWSVPLHPLEAATILWDCDNQGLLLSNGCGSVVGSLWVGRALPRTHTPGCGDSLACRPGHFVRRGERGVEPRTHHQQGKSRVSFQHGSHAQHCNVVV